MRGAALLALLLAGCGASELEDLSGVNGDATPPDDGGTPTDSGFGDDVGEPSDTGSEEDAATNCSPGTWDWGGDCLDACALLAALGCEDLDGDCFAPLDACPGTPAPDCDDHRPAVRPGATELCNDLDDNCDGAVDEGFDIGAECAACGVEGKRECALDDPTATACSTAFGQSQNPVEQAPEEICNGVDDDCDERVDEACFLELGGVDVSDVAGCGDGALLLVGPDGLVDGNGTPVAAGTLAAPSCGPAGAAWLALGETCERPADGPGHCPRAHLWVQPAGGEARDVTGVADLGPPIVFGGAVYWHALVGDTPVLNRTPLAGGSVETLLEDEPLSDPRPYGGLLAARSWTGGEAEVVLRSLGEDRAPGLLNNGPATGPAALSDVWVAWPIGSGPTLWAVPLADPRAGFQVPRGDGPQTAPTLVGGTLYWLDGLRLAWFELGTGAEGTVATDATTYAVGDGEVVWITPDGRARRDPLR